MYWRLTIKELDYSRLQVPANVLRSDSCDATELTQASPWDLMICVHLNDRDQAFDLRLAVCDALLGH